MSYGATQPVTSLVAPDAKNYDWDNQPEHRNQKHDPLHFHSSTEPKGRHAQHKVSYRYPLTNAKPYQQTRPANHLWCDNYHHRDGVFGVFDLVIELPSWPLAE